MWESGFWREKRERQCLPDLRLNYVYTHLWYTNCMSLTLCSLNYLSLKLQGHAKACLPFVGY